tara:strand:+ start:46 stop:408 length:363 start_codon:yes stop_codon:yes gene_type:complete
MCYSLDFRKKALSVRSRENLTIKETAARFDVGVSSINRWLKKIEPITKRTKPATKIDMDALAKDVATYSDSYLRERAARFNVSTYGISLALKRLGISYKKKLWCIPKQTKKSAHRISKKY